MGTTLDGLARELGALTQRFMDLGAKLGQAARALEDAGAPPADGLVEALGGARTQFIQLRTDIVAAAQAVAAAPTTLPESLNDLEPLLGVVAAALGAEARRAALVEAREAALPTLDRALAIVHRDDPAFPALVDCHEKARELRAAALALDDADASDAERVLADLQAFADLLTIIESRDALDDDHYAQLEESVSRAFGRGLAVAVSRGRLAFGDDVDATSAPAAEAAPAPTPEMMPPRIEAPPEPPIVQTLIETPPAPPALEIPPLEMPPLEMPPPEPSAPPPPPPPPPPRRPEPTHAPVFVAPAAPPEEPADTSGADETAQWWLAAWARWSGWKSSHKFADAVKEEIGKYPYLLSVPIQKSPQYEEGLLAYGYSILVHHADTQKPGCVGNALNSLKAGHTRPVGDQLYDYLVTEGRLAETYAEFVKNALVAAVPDPGLWFQFRILESKEDTRILQRPSARIGDTELSGQRLASDAQRYAEHKFKMTLGPLTVRFVLVSADIIKDARGIGARLMRDGAASDSGWIACVPAGTRAAKVEARRITEEGTHVPGLGKDYSALWIAVFNPDPAADRRYELSVFLRKDTKSPFRGKA